MSRPPKVTDDELKQILLDCVTKYNEKMYPLKLEKLTGIKRNVWARRMQNVIDEINQNFLEPVEIIDNSNVPLPNIADIVEKHYHNKDNLIQHLIAYNDYVSNLFTKSVNHDKLQKEIDKLKGELQAKEEHISFLKKEVENYKNQYFEVAAKSSYTHLQRAEGLKNVVSLKKNDKKAMSVDWEKDYEDIFD